jgi:hypothetical protein
MIEPLSLALVPAVAGASSGSFFTSRRLTARSTILPQRICVIVPPFCDLST